MELDVRGVPCGCEEALVVQILVPHVTASFPRWTVPVEIGVSGLLLVQLAFLNVEINRLARFGRRSESREVLTGTDPATCPEIIASPCVDVSTPAALSALKRWSEKRFARWRSSPLVSVVNTTSAAAGSSFMMWRPFRLHTCARKG